MSYFRDGESFVDIYGGYEYDYGAWDLFDCVWGCGVSAVFGVVVA